MLSVQITPIVQPGLINVIAEGILINDTEGY